MDKILALISKLVLKSRKINLKIYDKAFLKQTLDSRVSFTNTLNYDSYFDLISTSEFELNEFISLLTNSYSEFFRNPLVYSYLEDIILPLLLRNKTQNNNLRIWSAACSCGQEPYSIAILCEEATKNNINDLSYNIFATDIIEENLKKAKCGIYEFNNIKNTRLQYVNKYFTNSNDNYKVIDKLKSHIDFSKYDLLDTQSSSPPSSIFGGFDMIVCSNLLYYYSKDIQSFILNKLYKSLNYGSYLVCSEAEIPILKTIPQLKIFANNIPIFQK